MNRCRTCQRLLTEDEIAFHRKLFSRSATSYYCLDCAANYLEVSRERLEEKLLEYKGMGCTLFPENQ